MGPKSTVDVWLTQVRALYDTTELSASQSVLLSGRFVTHCRQIAVPGSWNTLEDGARTRR